MTAPPRASAGSAVPDFHLSAVVRVDHLVERTDGIHQMSVHGPPVSCTHDGIRRGDKPVFLQHCYIFAHGVLTHAYRFPDVPVAGPALMRLTVLAPFEVTIHCQFTGIQTQQEDLVGQREVGSTSVPDFPPPVCSSPSG